MRQGLVLFLLICGLSSVSFAGDPELILSAPSGSISHAMGDTASVTSSVMFDNTGPSDVDGWSYGVCHNGAELTLTAFADSALVSTINNGAAPGFGSTALVDGATGATQGVVIDLFGIQKLAPGVGYALSDATYENTMDGDYSSTIAICNTLGTPPVADVIVIAGASITPFEIDGVIDVTVTVDPEYARGECNGDGSYNIADGVYALNFLFQGGPASTCIDACDANGDGTVDGADAVYTFAYQLSDGPPPPAPFPGCGTVPGADCASFTCP